MHYEQRLRMGAIKPLLPNKPRDVQRINDRRRAQSHLLGPASGALWRDLPLELRPPRIDERGRKEETAARCLGRTVFANRTLLAETSDVHLLR
ncbi:hypothetical protein ACVIW0_001304 [Bradyrhizobium sp. USDA 4454]